MIRRAHSDGRHSARHDSAPAQRHIIGRPRLTKLLNETSARIIVLVAPAGYGKTTLARQWIGEGSRPHAWYQATAAAADPAELADQLSNLSAHLNRGTGVTVRERLRSSSAPPPSSASLAAILTSEFRTCPSDAWVVIDDYQFIASSSAEEVVARLIDAVDARFLIASRTRPEWFDMRRLLYGEALEIGQDLLTMTAEEAQDVLVNASVDPDEVMALASGWPAVIGLSALAPRPLPRGLVPHAMYDYIADELLEAVPVDDRDLIYMLALLPSIDALAVEAYAGARAHHILAIGIKNGFLKPLTTRRPCFEVHPLIRSFLSHKLDQLDPVVTRGAVNRIVHHLLERDLWDQAFEVVSAHPSADLFAALLEHALDPIGKMGRVATLDRWLEASAPFSRLPIYALGAAQARFMHGAYDEALALATQATRALDADSAMLSRAFRLAGTSAHMLDDEQAALTFHTRARQTAQSKRDRREAIWGQVLAAAEFTDAAELLEDLVAVIDETADDELAVASVRMLLDARAGDIRAALHTAWGIRSLLRSAHDPMVRTGFMNMLSNCLSLAARYSDARDYAEREADDASVSGLPFIEPYALCNHALAAWGSGNFALCDHLIDRFYVHHRRAETAYLAINVSVVAARRLLTNGEAAQAIQTLDQARIGTTRVLRAEHECVRALALAAGGESTRAMDLVRVAARTSPSVEVRVLVPAVRAVIAVTADYGDALDRVCELLQCANSTGNFDAVVLAYRTCPAILGVLPAGHPRLAWLAALAKSCNDQRLFAQARRVPAEVSSRFATLTTRETEILEMVAAGFTNREISSRLFISDVTVKTHLRSVYRKLGVRTRTQAAVRFLQ